MDINSEKDFYMWLGNEFKTLREKRGLLQKDVADKVGIKPTDLSRFERYGEKLSAFRIALLFKAIGIPFEKLVQEDDDDVKKNSPSPSMAVAWAT